MRALFLVAALAIALVGCDDGKTYRGKPGSEWLALSHDTDPGTRESTVVPLQELSESEDNKYRDRLNALLDDESPEVKVEAISKCYHINESERLDRYIAVYDEPFALAETRSAAINGATVLILDKPGDIKKAAQFFRNAAENDDSKDVRLFAKFAADVYTTDSTPTP